MRTDLHKEYYSTGQLWFECSYINDKMCGITKLYNKTGKIDILSYFKYNIKYHLEYKRDIFVIHI